MVKKINKKAFSLVEMLVSMMIIMVVVAGFIPTLTKSKPKLDITTKRGQYGCWYEGSQIYEQYFDERTPRTAPKPVSKCHLKLDQSPAHFYILATGAGCNDVSGQTTTLYTPGLAETLDITLGKVNINDDDITARDEKCTTKVSSNSTADLVIANGGFKFANNYINPYNLSTTNPCKLASANQVCPKDSSKIQQSCTVSEITGNSKESRFIVRINGCEGYDEFGNPNEDNIIKLSSLKYSNISEESEEIEASTSTDGRYYYKGDYKMRFTNADSVFNSLFRKKSKMSQILEHVPAQRKSELTEKIKLLEPGAIGKNGAVIILW